MRKHSSELLLVKCTHIQSSPIHAVIHLDFLLFDCIALAFVSAEEKKQFGKCRSELFKSDATFIALQ